MKGKIVSSALSVILAFSIFGGLSLIGVVEASTVSASQSGSSKNTASTMIDTTECPVALLDYPHFGETDECLPEIIDECLEPDYLLPSITDEECYVPIDYTSPSRIKNAVIRATNTTIKVGKRFDIMKNVSARDNGGRGVDLTNKITVEGSVNTRKIGSYNITYSVKGANENLVLKTITVYVKK